MSVRTDDEIVAYCKEVAGADILGFIRSDLCVYLAKERIRDVVPNVPQNVLDEVYESTPKDAASVLAQIHKYMSFAWDKANNCRGLSAGRSIHHMSAWLWMLGFSKASKQLIEENYTHYGKPQLRAICEKLGWDWQEWDDGKWRNNEIEAPCSPDEVPGAELDWARDELTGV